MSRIRGFLDSDAALSLGYIIVWGAFWFVLVKYGKGV